MKSFPKKIKIGSVVLGDKKPVVVAGPCVVESLSMLRQTAAFLEEIASEGKVQIVLKISYDKANRTSSGSFRGPGIEKGIDMISSVRKEVSLPVLVDIHCRSQAALAASAADCLQIPAFLCRQTDLIQAAASTGLPVNIKKGQFMSPGAMKMQGEKAQEAGEGGVIFTERGTSFGYSDLIVDMRSIVLMKESGAPVLLDVTHSQQNPPSGDKENSSGSRKFTIPLSRAAIAAGADGIYAEVHPNPEKAKSDSKTQLDFGGFKELINALS